MSSDKSPVRIAFCITDLDPGGAERALVQLVKGLDRGRWEPAVFCLAGHGALADELQAAGTKVECLGARHWSSLWVVLRLARELRRHDLVVDLGDETFRLKKSFEAATKAGAKYILILGENEVKVDAFSLKNLATGEQVSVPRGELARWIQGK